VCSVFFTYSPLVNLAVKSLIMQHLIPRLRLIGLAQRRLAWLILVYCLGTGAPHSKWFTAWFEVFTIIILPFFSLVYVQLFFHELNICCELCFINSPIYFNCHIQVLDWQILSDMVSCLLNGLWNLWDGTGRQGPRRHCTRGSLPCSCALFTTIVVTLTVFSYLG
jgi:hypothetical protein